MKLQLAPDATLRSIVSQLTEPEEFVRAVLFNMRGGKLDMQVRLALDTKASAPDYLLEMLFDDMIDGEEVEIPQSLVVIRGRSHKDLPSPESFFRPWSDVAMKYADVQQLLGEIRGILPKPHI